MSKPLRDQNAFVTGGGSGIGLACASAFARDGANVLIMGRDEGKLRNAVGQISAIAEEVVVDYHAGDVGREEDVQDAVEKASLDGRLDIAVANAGTGNIGPLMVTDASTWDAVMQTNLTGTFYCFKHAAAVMARSGGGAICAISSIAGVRTHRFMGPYCASKAGVDMLVRSSADELGVANIRVNSVCPGLVDTELATALMTTSVVREDYLDCMPIRRTGVPEDISNAVRFLCGPESGWITGVVLTVDGGHHLRRGPNVEPLSRLLYGDEIHEGRLP